MSDPRPLSFAASGLGRSAADRVVVPLLWMAALAVAAAFGWIVFDVVRFGAPRLSPSFVLGAPRDAGRAGGIGPVVVATALIVLVCLAAALPVGLGTALVLADPAGGRWRRAVRRSLDVLAGVPSIVFGLFGNAFFCIALGMGYSILAGGLTLACMVLPLFIRTAEEGLRAVPVAQRHAAAALGLSRWRTIVHVLLPAAAPALAAGLVLGLGRALAETAALLFTSGFVDRMPTSLLDSGRALSVHVYDLSMNVAGGEPNAYGAALVLLVLLVAVNAAAAWLGRRLGRSVAGGLR